jgi:non-ribosomal peptide synthetase component F
VWQREWLQGEVLEEQLRYWRKQLEGVVPLELPTMSGASGYPKSESSVLTVDSSVVNRIAAAHEATVFMTMLTVFALCLYRHTGQRDMVIASDIANRNHSEIEPLVGFFVNQLLIRLAMDDEFTFRQVLAKVRQTSLDAFHHQELPFEKLVEIMRPNRSANEIPWTRAKLVVQNAPVAAVTAPGLSIQAVTGINPASKYDLLLDIRRSQDGSQFVIKLAYDISAVSRSMAETLLHNMKTIMEIAEAEPDTAASAIATRLRRAEIGRQREKVQLTVCRTN